LKIKKNAKPQEKLWNLKKNKKTSYSTLWVPRPNHAEKLNDKDRGCEDQREVGKKPGVDGGRTHEGVR